MYILADIKKNCRKSRFIKEQRRLLIFSYTKKFLLFNVKDFIFNSISVKYLF